MFNSSKIFLATLTLTSLPLIANATLETFNYTNEDSSVRVTINGNPGPCSSEAGVYTPKSNADGTPGHSFVKDSEITLLCLGSKNKTCKAYIYNTNNCSGEKIGYAELNLTTKQVTRIDNLSPSRYLFISENNGTLLRVKYAS